MLFLVLRRLRDLAIVLLLVGTAIFFIVRLIPGDPAIALAGEQATAEQIAKIRDSLGLDAPLWRQYLAWLGGLVHGDLGDSVTYHAPVLPITLAHLLPTILLAVIATVLSLLLAVPLSIQSALRPGGITTRIIDRGTSVAIAIPEFWLALILVILLAVKVRAFPVSGFRNPFTDPIGAIPYLVLPVIVLMVGQVATFTLNLRESMVSEMLLAYLRTARAKGLRERAVFYRHALPNALLPTITVVGNSFGVLLGGVVVIETIFAIPGLGSLLYQGIATRDYSLIEGVTVVVAVLFVMLNFLIDMLYIVVDPKARVS